MQKLDFNDEGKLVAYTDNGCTDGKSAITEVKGTFEVSADVVNYILSKEYDLPATLRAEMGEKMYGYYRFKHLYCLIGNEGQQKLLQEYKQRVDEQQKLLDEQQKLLQEHKRSLDKVKDELKRLIKAVDDFNKNARFYERKIKI